MKKKKQKKHKKPPQMLEGGIGTTGIGGFNPWEDTSVMPKPMEIIYGSGDKKLDQIKKYDSLPDEYYIKTSEGRIRIY